MCTLIGSIITAAMLSSIPIYTEGILQRVLTKDLEIFQQETNNFPGGYLVEYDGTFSGTDGNMSFDSFDNKISQVVFKSIELPVLSQCKYIDVGNGRVKMEDGKKEIDARISALYEIKDHINIVNGRIFSGQQVNGIYEVIASEEAMKVSGLTLDKVYTVSYKKDASFKSEVSTFKIKVVGLYSYKSENDPYWFNDISAYRDTIFMDSELLTKIFMHTEKASIKNTKWYVAYDYHKIKLSNLPSVLETLDVHAKWFEKNRMYMDYKLSAKPILEKYDERAKTLKTTLLVLQVPILILLGFYSFMVSNLKVDFESNEIAVLKSRGGSSSLIFSMYLIECLLISAISLIIGPLLGLYMCRIIGSSNGFLEFVQRAALPLSLGPKAYLYALGGVLLSTASLLIPALISSRLSIVQYKQNKTRGKKTIFWKKYFVDFILLALATYGLFAYKRQQKVLYVSGLKGNDLGIDPLLFLISVIFILGCGLLVLRVFPYLTNLIFAMGRKIWDSVLYATFTSVSRTSGKEQFTMIFIILTISIGIFSASSARTINKNIEEKVKYQVGADIVVNGHWASNRSSGTSLHGQSSGSTDLQRAEELVYYEPPFEMYTKLKGVESVTKVFREDNVKAITGNLNLSQVSLLGIIPEEFGKTAWFKNNLLPFHWYEYLNLLTDSPTAVLVSKSFKDKLKAKEGDTIIIRWGQQKDITGVIYSFLDYWPSLNPNKKVEDKPSPYFIVANLDYINAVRSVEPYEVWIKKRPEATSTQIYNDMENKKIDLDTRKDTTEILTKSKNDPILQGTNGSLTLGFIVTIIICSIGFIIYWMMSIKKRVLQFGIFRAMGLSIGRIIKMIVYEQLLITGTSVIAGIVIGGLTSKIFVPMLQLVYGTEEQVPPFEVITHAGDYIRLYVVIAIMLLICFVVLWRLLLKINIGQALKMGED